MIDGLNHQKTLMHLRKPVYSQNNEARCESREIRC